MKVGSKEKDGDGTPASGTASIVDFGSKNKDDIKVRASKEK
jgi:hypothetical protein